MRNNVGEPAAEPLLSSEPPPGGDRPQNNNSQNNSQTRSASPVQPNRHQSARQQLPRHNSREIKRDRKLVQKLQVASEDLLDRLFTFLSRLPEEESDGDAAGCPQVHHHANQESSNNNAGITLPASAIGWLASQFFGNARLLNPDHWVDETEPSSDLSRSYDASVLSASVHDRLALLKYLLPRLQQLRISTDPWPKTKQNATLRSDAGVVTDFLQQYLQLLYSPIVDLRLFPNLTVLVLDQVPPDHVSYLSSLQHLQVLRIEQSCIYNLPNLFARRDMTGAISSSSDDPLMPPNDAATSFLPQLKRVKLSQCCLTSDSLIDEWHISPLSRLTQLHALSLSHNQLRRAATLLRALRNKPFLSRLDLSHNQLTRLHQAYLCLGNLQELNLSHNQLVSTNGLDRLFSLEALWLDHNRLPDVASLAGLARLPLLRHLTLYGNPLEKSSPTSRRSRPRGAARAAGGGHRGNYYYRIPVLDLFVQQRLPALGPQITWRQLQRALPLLDGDAASIGELQTLRHRAFVVIPTDGYLLVQRRRPVVVAANTPIPGQFSRRGTATRRTAPVTIEDGTVGSSSSLVPVDTRPLDPNCLPALSFTVLDVLESISNGIGDNDHSVTDDEDVVQPLDEQDEVLDTTPTKNEMQPEGESKAIVQGEEDPSLESDTGVEAQQPAPQGELEWHEDADELISAASVNDSRLNSELDISSISPIRHSDHVAKSALKSSGATTETCGTTETPADRPESPTNAHHNDPDTTAEGGESTPLASRTEEPHSSESSNQTPAEQLNYRVLSSNLWQDDNVSVATSAGAASHPVDDTQGQLKYALAEENSVFEVASYKQLNVSDNLEFYFQVFVFNYSLIPVSAATRVPSSTHSLATTIDGHNDWMSVLERYPKIQLWPLDRRMREAYAEKAQLTGKLEGSPASEELRRVWTERVVACGQPALRRLTPNRGARFGFHGELLWSAASTSHIKPQTVAECRELIVCLSSTSFYLIVHHDSVSARSLAKDPSRQFPVPLAQDATFQNAKWPHALVWHPWHTLSGITIGFGFQRLTLRFANSTFPSPDDFMYILLTCNKLETVRLLKEIQSLASDNSAGGHLGVSVAFGGLGALSDDANAIAIDNDDRHVLDALGVAVAPDVMGAILHYQIVWQYWRHGDRGTVRRACVVTDATVYLLDEDYVGDGSESTDAGHNRALGETTYRVVDAAALSQITVVKAANADPCALTVSIKPTSRLSRTHNWRLLCKDREGAEQLVDDLRKATTAE